MTTNIPTSFDLDAPVYIDPDPQAWYDFIVASYETKTGRTFPTEGPIVDQANTFAQGMSIEANNLNYTGRQVLRAFATGPRLDSFADLWGVTRLAPNPAKATVRFTTQDGVAISARDSVIPAGTQLTTDDAVTFTTDESVTMEVGASTVEVSATAVTPGTGGNGIQIGDIKNINSPISNPLIFNGTVSNIEITSGGGATESDERFRRRLYFVIESKSTAGSSGMYEYWALSYSSNIAAAYAYAEPDTGVATIYILEQGGSIPSQATLDAIALYINADDVRPMCDLLDMQAASQVNYNVVLVVDYYPSAAAYIDEQLTLLESQVEELAEVNQDILGRDIIPNEYVRLGMNLEGTYDVTVTEPAATAIGPGEFSVMGSVTITKGTEKS